MKYKLWCKDKNEWEKDSWVILPNGNIAWIEYGNIVGCANPKNHILVRSTGLKDENGREIYEGDIIKNECFVPGVVEWKQDLQRYDICKRIDEMRSSHIIYLCYDIANEFEVIGNIYENPELLERE